MTQGRMSIASQLSDDIYEVAQDVGDQPYDVPPTRHDEYSRLSTSGMPSANLGVEETDDYNHTSTWTLRQNSGGSGSQNNHSDSSDTKPSLKRGKGVRKSAASTPPSIEEGKPIPNSNASPALYEDAWDTVQKRQQLEERLRLARTISTTSEKFEDALEFLPEEPAPPEKPARAARRPAPVSGDTYEEAWDLNRGLEEKLRKAQLMHAGDTDTYQEPWDTASKQRELEDKLRRASSGGGTPASHKPQPAGSDLYEEAWDIKRNSLSHLVMGTLAFILHSLADRFFSRTEQISRSFFQSRAAVAWW